VTARSSLCSIGMLALAGNAWAQSNSIPDRMPRVELWGAVMGVTSGPSGALTTSYSPPLLFDGDFTSHAGQTLSADSGFVVGFTGGVNVFPTPHVGFQILMDRASGAVRGSNTSYTMNLQYISRLPSTNEAQPVNINQAVLWPDTSGTLTQVTIAVNAVVRLGRPDRVALTVSGGPTVYRLSGAVQPLAFTTFRLGGHSVLFEDDYRLAMALAPTNALGFDAGGEINVPVSRHAALVAGYRYIVAPTAAVAVSPTAILNGDQVIVQEALSDITAQLRPAPMRVSISGSRVLFGLKFTFH
jgi:hypothetical protein